MAEHSVSNRLMCLKRATRVAYSSTSALRILALRLVLIIHLLSPASAHYGKGAWLSPDGANFRVPACLTCSPERPICDKARPTCDPDAEFRTIDGTCNNLDYPAWGAANTMYNRLLKVAYKDGEIVPRGDGYLPTPRVISATVHRDLNFTAPYFTHLLSAFSQFIDHDVTLAPDPDLDCCGTEAKHPLCYPLRIPKDDYFYSKFGVTCQNFSRIQQFCLNETIDWTAEQVNEETSFIDASNVYGPTRTVAQVIRTFTKGQLLTNKEDSYLLPSKDDVERLYGKGVIDQDGEFITGDNRGNQNPLITALQNLFLREHNRLAYEIYTLRPHWNDERIYQMARKILIAEYEHIVYSEYLPNVLGPAVMHMYDLNTESDYTYYNGSINPSIFHDFSAGAERFGHSLVRGQMSMVKGKEVVLSFLLRDAFTNSKFMKYQNNRGYSLLLCGMFRQPSMDGDPYITEDLTNFLEKAPDSDFGDDLTSTDIQRGREVGIQDYSSYREYCGLEGLKTWDERPEEISEYRWAKLRSVYQKPADIDLITGGLCEYTVSEGIVGPTFACIIAEQFRRLKHGDRFFYTHAYQKGSFKKRQLSKIKNVTLSDIICRNSNIQSAPKNVFRFPDVDNEELSCYSPDRYFLNTEDFLSAEDQYP